MPPPTTHTSEFDVPQTAWVQIGSLCEDHPIPSQCKRVPLLPEVPPTTQMSDAEAPQMPLRLDELPALTVVQVEPFQRTIAPFSPTTQTLLAELPQMPCRFAEVPLE